MNEVPEIHVDSAPVFDLDLERLGAIVRLMPAAASRVGHDSIKALLGYVAASDPESEFIRAKGHGSG